MFIRGCFESSNRASPTGSHLFTFGTKDLDLCCTEFLGETHGQCVLSSASKEWTTQSVVLAMASILQLRFLLNNSDVSVGLLWVSFRFT